MTITGTNDGPIAVDDTQTTSENVAIGVDVLANDTDLDGSDTLSVASVDTTNTNGSVTITGGGTGVNYNPGTAYDYLAVGE